MNKYKPNISNCFTIVTFFIFCLGFIFPWSIKGRTLPYEEPTPVILIGGLGGTFLSDKLLDNLDNSSDNLPPKDRLLPCTSNPFKNIKRRLDVLTSNPQNLELNYNGEPEKKLKPVGFLRVPRLKPFLNLRDICDLSLYLQSQSPKYELNRNLFEFYYDYRYSVQHNAEELKKFVAKYVIEPNP